MASNAPIDAQKNDFIRIGKKVLKTEIDFKGVEALTLRLFQITKKLPTESLRPFKQPL